MADELSLLLRVTAAKAGATLDTGSVSVEWDMAGTDMAGWFTQTVTTGAHQALNVPAAIGFPAHVIIQNLGANPVTISIDSGGTNDVATLASGDPPYVVPGCLALPYMQSTTGNALIRAIAIEI